MQLPCRVDNDEQQSSMFCVNGVYVLRTLGIFTPGFQKRPSNGLIRLECAVGIGFQNMALGFQGKGATGRFLCISARTAEHFDMPVPEAR